MSIVHQFKRAVTWLGAFGIFASSFAFTGTALADVFSDVKPDRWSYGFVEQGVKDGYFDAGFSFRPDDNANRFEVATVVCRVIKCLNGFEMPATPTFKDVQIQPKQWFSDSVEALAAQGVITGDTNADGTPTGFYRGGDKVTRPEALALFSRALNVPENLTPGNVFRDVVLGTWYEPIVTTAYNWSMIDGYKTAAGEMTFEFGVNDPVTREQIAKMAYTSQNLVDRDGGTTPDVCDPLTDPNCKDDVCPEDDPEDPDCKPITCDPNDPEDEDCEAPEDSEGDIEVSLSDDTPEGDKLALGATHVEMAKFDFSAVKEAVTLTSLIVERECVGQNEDFEQVYLYDGLTRLTTGRAINSNNEAKFPLKYVVPAGETKTLTLVGDVAGPDVAESGNEHCFTLDSEESVKHNGVDTTGDFPLKGNEFEIAGQNSVVTSIEIEAGPQPSKVKLGEEGAEIASFKLDVGSENEDVILTSIALNNAGTFDSEDLENLVLIENDKELAKAEGFIGDIATFELDDPLVLKGGQDKTFYVEADLVGGKGGETFKLYLEEDADLYAIDDAFDQGASVDNKFTLSLANTVEVEEGDLQISDNGPNASQIANDSENNVLLRASVTPASDLSVRNTQVALTVEDQSGNAPIFNAGNTGTLADAVGTCAGGFELITAVDEPDFTVGDFLSVGDSFARVVSNPGSTDVTPGLCVASDDDLDDELSGTENITELNVYKYFEDLEVVDEGEDDETLAGPLGTAADGTLCTADEDPLLVCPDTGSYAKDFKDSYELEAGKTLKLAVLVDVGQEVTSGYQVNADLTFAEDSIKNEASNQFVPLDSIVGTPVNGENMLISADDLFVFLSSNPSSHTAVAGSTDEAMGFDLVAGDSGDIEVDRIPVRVYADADGNPFAGITPFPGNVDAKQDAVKTVYLYDEGNKKVGEETLSLVNKGAPGFDETEGDFYQVVFEDLNLEIESGETENMTVKIDILDDAPDGTTIALDINAAEIQAQDDDDDDIDVSGGLINGNGTDTKDIFVTVGQAGALTAQFKNNPEADILVMGTSNNFVSQTTFHAEDEGQFVERLTIATDIDGGEFNNPANVPVIEKVKIEYKNKANQTKTKEANLSVNGVVTFNMEDDDRFYIPEDDDRILKVYVTLSDDNPETESGTHVRVGLQNINDQNSFKAYGEGSGDLETFSDEADVIDGDEAEEFVVRETKPTVTEVGNGTDLDNQDNQKLFNFKVTANSNGDVALARMVFDIDLDTTNGFLDNFKLFEGNSPIDAQDINIVEAATGDNLETAVDSLDASGKVIVSFDEEIIVDGSTEFSLRAFAHSFDTDDSVSTRLSQSDDQLEVDLTENEECGAADNEPCHNGFGNSGRIFETEVDNALFTGADDNFSLIAPAGRDFIWSDQYVPNHDYPTVSDGVVTNFSGTFDFTNGFLLDLNDLGSQSLER